jgi:hypothetical protein
MSLLLIGAALVFGASSCSNVQGDQRAAARSETTAVSSSIARPQTRQITADDAKRYRDAAALAWKYLDANYQRSTGFVNATPNWANTTIWDVGGQLLAMHAAKGLGFIDPAEFDKRMTRTLGTLEKVSLFHNVAFQRVYDTQTGGIGAGGGHGFAATDLGRFMVAMKVLTETEPQYAAQIARIVRRIDVSQIVRGGYVYGQNNGTDGKTHTFQEGRIGYEQYVARGFSEWGNDVANAMDLKKNSKPLTIYGVPLLQDTRYMDRLLSEPFILYGVELGMPPEVQDLAASVLKAQQARFDSTGKMTIVSEDASIVPPNYFYYYCVYCNGKPFVIDIASPGKELDSPRWVSTKAAFGWNALMPSDYTRKAIDFVAAAADPKRGWSSGVSEATGKSTNAWDVNTASVILETAYYVLRGNKPLIDKATELITP